MVTLAKLTKQFLKECADLQRVWAISLGLPGGEGKVSDFSESRIREHRASLKKILRELNQRPPESKYHSAWMDAKLLRSELKIRQWEWGAAEGKYQSNPTLYVGELVYGLWYLLLRIPSPRLKVEACLGRLRSSGEILTAARANLREPPKLWTQIALREIQGYLDFLKEVQKELLRLAPNRRSEILKAVRDARRVGEEFKKFLRGPLMRNSRGSFQVGEKRFNFLLKNYHHYSINASGLFRFGKSQFEEIRRSLEEQARKIDPKATWGELILRVKKNHPSRRRLLPVYRQEVTRLKRFLRTKKLVTIPKGERLRVTETPRFTRTTIPYAAYVDPPMFSGANVGTFFVTPVPGKNKKTDQEILEEHNFSSLKVTALHEGYPGHHLQFATQKSVTGIMGRIFNCSSFYEGWALYCEEMMYESGYYDEWTRLLQLRDKLWRACRILIDVGLQTGTLTDQEAVKFLARETAMSPTAARADINWYTMSPTVPQGYLTGMLRIRALREKIRKQEGSRFSLKRFHDRLLRYGAVPIPLLEKILCS